MVETGQIGVPFNVMIMHIGIKLVIAIVLIIVFIVVYLAFVGGATGEASSFLESIWKGIEALFPFK